MRRVPARSSRQFVPMRALTGQQLVYLTGFALIVAGVVCLCLSDAVVTGWRANTLDAFGVGFVAGALRTHQDHRCGAEAPGTRVADGQADEQPAGRSVLRPVKDDSAFGNPEHDAQFRGSAGIAIKLAELDDEDLLDPRLRRELNRLVPDANWRPGLVSIRCGISRLSASDATTVPVRVGPQVQALPRRPAGAGSSGLARVGGLLAVDDADCTRGRLPLAFLAGEGGGAGREQRQLAQAEEALFLCPHDGVAQATPGHGSPPGQNPRAVDSASVSWMTDRPSRVRHDRSQPQTRGGPSAPGSGIHRPPQHR